ncbi:PrsW family intramembrane metalloprotease [Fonticella tunisiensis]|nr:PrsW family glutamic-type intramembrane protease [Fonticella tunisiensis]
MIVVAIAPSLALILYIYQKDRYDREPPLLLFFLFIFGIFIALPVYYVEKFLASLYYNIFYHAYIVAGFTEESFKYAVVRRYAYSNKHYDEKLDGIIYCVFVSLGFATAENVLYVINGDINYLYTGITRALFAVPAHMLFAITMGYYLSIAKFSKRRVVSIGCSVKSLLVPILLHGTYDYILFLRQYGVFPIFILFVVYLWRINLKRLNEYVRESREDA